MFHLRVLAPAFRKKKEGQNALLAFAIFQVPLTQYNQYAKMAYFGVVCSEPPQEGWRVSVNGYRVSLVKMKKFWR